MSRAKRTLAIDFDGVIHKYEGYCDGLIQGPIPGAREGIERLVARGHDVVIFTTRPGHIVRDWLVEHGFPPLGITNVKRPFYAILDDRAVRFDGSWDGVADSLEKFKPYWWAQAQAR